MLFALCATANARLIHAQTEASTRAEDEPDRLFERGQDAQAQKNYLQALGFYEQALKLRPEFPEAEYQMAATLVSLDRPADAEQAYRRAAGLRPDWPLPPAALGALLARRGRDSEAVPFLSRALELDPKNRTALVALASIRQRQGAPGEAITLLRRATDDPTAPSYAWVRRAAAERAAGDRKAAEISIANALRLDPRDLDALVERSELYAAAGDYAHAIEDLKVAVRLAPPGPVSDSITLRLAQIYARSGDHAEALKTLDMLPAAVQQSAEARALRLQLEPTADGDPKSCAAIAEIIEKEPRNASLIARAGECYRTIDPLRSAEFFRRAAEIEPANPDYATGYAAALVRARRFEEAIAILRNILAHAPDQYTAHANLATALIETKRYGEAIAEYKWILAKKPDMTVANYFLGVAYDNLRYYTDALAAYEAFLSHADATRNQLEIEKVNLRLASLRRQIKRGEGAKRN